MWANPIVILLAVLGNRQQGVDDLLGYPLNASDGPFDQLPVCSAVGGSEVG